MQRTLFWPIMELARDGGAVHDTRDFAFAKVYGLSIETVIAAPKVQNLTPKKQPGPGRYDGELWSI